MAVLSGPVRFDGDGHVLVDGVSRAAMTCIGPLRQAEPSHQGGGVHSLPVAA